MKNQIWYLLVLVLLSFVFGSCGNDPKKDKESRSPNSNIRKPKVPSQIWNFIQRQELECNDKILCNESMAKLVIIDSETIRYCTGALIGPKLLVTSASCLSRELKVPKMICTENIFAIFPGTNIRTKEIAKCDHIVSVDINESIETSLWKSDLAFIQLQSAPSRQQLEISREGILADNTLEVWKVDYTNDVQARAIREDCYPVFNSYMNPFAGSEFSPMIPLSKCDFNEGNRGSLVLDDTGKLVGVVSGGLEDSLKEFVIRSGLLKGKLNSLVHVTNLACARLPGDLLTNQYEEDCFKQISQANLDKLRATLLKTTKVHEANMNRIERQIRETSGKYLELSFSFKADNKKSAFELHMGKPRCFKKVDSWIHEFRSWGRIRTYGMRTIALPHYRLKTAFNGDLQVTSDLQELGEKEYEVAFNPRAAWSFGKSYVSIKSKIFDDESEERYDDIPKECSKY